MDESDNAGHAARPRFTAVHVVLALVGTIVAAWVLSFIYAIAEHYSPLIYLNLILAFGFGWLGELVLADAQPLRGGAHHADQWLKVQGFACAQCNDEDSYATISLVMMQPNKKKKNELERSQKVLARLAPIDLELEKKLFEPQPAEALAPTEEAEAEE